MNIGFDAKRAYLNESGLGNYARSLIQSLAQQFPENHYTLFTPKRNSSDFSRFISAQKNTSVVQPAGLIDKKLNARWRSYGITRLLDKNKIEVFHGLSNELPFNIQKFKGKKIVTIHDLIFLRHPELYPILDRKIYDKKFRSACELADVIVAVSEQTKNDMIEFYKIDPKKINVIYQSCGEAFYKEHSNGSIKEIKTKYKLPDRYLLYVGTIEERKNLLTLVKALPLVKDIPLVVIGKKKAYHKKVLQEISSNHLNKRVAFPENVLYEDLPAIYRGADIFIYPSLFEGFGIPILEAITCKTPVITTKGGCFEEAGGPGSVYIGPKDPILLAEEINKIIASSEIRMKMAESGYEHSKKFRPEVIAKEMMKLYKQPK